MKKFLFTLAALLVAGTAFADSYLYVAKTDYANAKPGDQLEIPVRAHYEELVSAWQADFNMPQGMTLEMADKGADLTLEYMNKAGRTATMTPQLYNGDTNPNRYITASAEAGYWVNPETGARESYGPVKWAVGDYAEMLVLYVTVTDEYQGGDISIHFAPACGEDKRPANMVGIRSDAKVIDMPAVDNLLTGKVVIGDVEAETGLVPVSYDAQDGNIRVARINGAEVALNQGKIQLTEEGTYFISACATANGYNEIIGTKIVTWTKPVTVEKPTITFAGEETTTMTVTVECEDTEATLIVNGEEIESNVYTYTVERADLYTAGTVEVTAQAKKGDVLSEEVKESKAWVVKEKPQFDATVKVNHTGDENNFYLLYRTEGADPDQNPEVTVTVTVDGTPLTNVEFLQNWTLVQDDTDPDNGYMKAIYNHVKLTEPGEHIVKVELTVAPGPGYVGDPKTASAEWKYTINNKFQGEIVFGDVDPTTGKMKVSYNGPEEGYTMSISLNGQDADVDENGMIQLQEGENKIIVTLTKAGYDMKTAEANPTWTKPAPKDLQGEIVFGDVDEETGLMPVSYNGDENVTLTVTINGEQVEVVDGKVQLVDGNNAVVVTATAAGYNDLTETKEIEWTKPTPKELTGEITIGDPDDNGGVAVAYTGNENVTLDVTVKDANGKEVEFTFENGVVTLPDYGTYTVEVVASADGYNDKEANKEVTWTKPTPKELTGKITFSVTQGNKNKAGTGIVTATYDGEETGVTVKIVGDPTKVAAATSEGVRLPDYGTYKVMAVATAEGYADLEEEGEVTWDEPQTDAPEFNVSEDGLTVEATGEGTVTLYVVDADGNATAIDNPTTFDQKDQAYEVTLKAVAHVDGAKDGVATKTIIIPAKSTEPGTGVNELVDGKAVKSVRYFNMAGQEMQEVNGVTIVVTTYTDGTTSAVKVMK